MSPPDTEKESQSENRSVFRHLRDVAEESASPIVCGRAFQSLRAELEKALTPSCLLLYRREKFCGSDVRHFTATVNVTLQQRCEINSLSDVRHFTSTNIVIAAAIINEIFCSSDVVYSASVKAKIIS